MIRLTTWRNLNTKQRICNRTICKISLLEKDNTYVSNKSQSRKNSQNHTTSFIRNLSEIELNRQDKFKSLRGLTRQIYSHLDEGKKVSETDDVVDLDIASDQIVQQLKAKKNEEGLKSMVEKDLILPSEIREKLGLIADLLLPVKSHSFASSSLSQENSNFSRDQWNLILSSLKQEGGFVGISKNAIVDLVRAIPRQELKFFIPTIEKLLEEANLQVPTKVHYYFMKSLTMGGHLTNSQLELIEKYFDLVKSENGLKSNHYETLIYAYVKSNQMKKVENVLNAMKTNNIGITSSIFNAIMQGYIFYEKDYKKALQTFDAMKFASLKTKPGERAYSDIILACVMNDDLEKAFDLFEEMKQNNISPNQEVFCSLAKGCAKSKKYKQLAWNYVFEIYDRNWKPNLNTFETMLYISSQDGDVALTRALFYKMMETNAVTKQSFIALFKAYSKFKSSEDVNLIDSNSKGRIFKTNIIKNVDFMVLVNGFPFLPYKSLNEDLILAESSAIWAYIIMSNSNMINQFMVTLYLNIASNLGGLNDFKDRYNETTFLDPSGMQQNRQIIDEKPDDDAANSDRSLSSELMIKKSPILLQAKKHSKVPRDTLIYIIALKAGAKALNIEFINSIVQERGLYRKTTHFKTLSLEKQKKLDFDFAISLCHTYLELNMLEDSLGIVLSTENLFPWKYHHLKKLKLKGLEYGNVKIVNEIQNTLHRLRLN